MPTAVEAPSRAATSARTAPIRRGVARCYLGRPFRCVAASLPTDSVNGLALSRNRCFTPSASRSFVVPSLAYHTLYRVKRTDVPFDSG